jgi:hypothetical protein
VTFHFVLIVRSAIFSEVGFSAESLQIDMPSLSPVSVAALTALCFYSGIAKLELAYHLFMPW